MLVVVLVADRMVPVLSEYSVNSLSSVDVVVDALNWAVGCSALYRSIADRSTDRSCVTAESPAPAEPRLIFGIAMAPMIAIITITTTNSIKLNPAGPLRPNFRPNLLWLLMFHPSKLFRRPLRIYTVLLIVSNACAL